MKILHNYKAIESVLVGPVNESFLNTYYVHGIGFVVNKEIKE